MYKLTSQYSRAILTRHFCHLHRTVLPRSMLGSHALGALDIELFKAHLTAVALGGHGNSESLPEASRPVEICS